MAKNDPSLNRDGYQAFVSDNSKAERVGRGYKGTGHADFFHQGEPIEAPAAEADGETAGPKM